MEAGSSSNSGEKSEKQSIARKFGSMLPKIEPFRPKYDHSPTELRSWAKKTGFISTFSSEASASFSERIDSARFDLEKGSDLRNGAGSPKIEIDPVLGRTKPSRNEIEPAVGSARWLVDGKWNRKTEENSDGAKVNEMRLGRNGNDNNNSNRNGNDSNLNGLVVASIAAEPKREYENGERVEEVNLNLAAEEVVQGGFGGPSGLRLGVRDNPGFASLIYYGIQHFLSLAGSLIFIPLIIVPTMGGTDKDTATVISTMLMVSGISTILHSYFGTRLPLVQGSSFVYLAPVLVIMNGREYRNLTEHKFRHIMRELQGAIIVGSIFQSFLGFSGLMSLLLRLINPVVVAPTVAAIGLAFFSFGFPQAGSCIEISIPQILLVLIFTLYLRKISIFGHRLFRIYAVPLSVVIIWIYAFSLTTGGAYDYKGCNSNVPSSNILTEECRKHTYTMEHCRTDASDAWRTAEWVRVPYPFQWGFPIFNFRTSLIMIITSLVATVDSVGTYHSAFVRVTTVPPTPGIVSRGIAMEGFCSILAGLWGTGTGSTTLTENVHTINVTKVASRRAVEVGALFMIFFSCIGKLGAILASIPLALAAAVLCFMWALTVALGLLTLQYTQTASFRNITIVGVSLFLGSSIPAYFQQYNAESSFILPGYFLPYAAASNGPFHTGNKQLDFAFNALMSMNMVVTLLVAFVLDNTVPGSREERGVYLWSRIEETEVVSTSFADDFALPRCISWICCRAKCLSE